MCICDFPGWCCGGGFSTIYSRISISSLPCHMIHFFLVKLQKVKGVHYTFLFTLWFACMCVLEVDWHGVLVKLVVVCVGAISAALTRCLRSIYICTFMSRSCLEHSSVVATHERGLMSSTPAPRARSRPQKGANLNLNLDFKMEKCSCKQCSVEELQNELKFCYSCRIAVHDLCIAPLISKTGVCV